MIQKPLITFRFFNFDVKIHASWLIIGILLVWTFGKTVFPAALPGLDAEIYWRMALLSLLTIIFSILVHEVAHAIIAEHYDMPIAGITLFVFGGVAEMKGPPSHPKGEFFMAIAGPIMSGMLGIFFWASGVFYDHYITPEHNSAVIIFLGYMSYLNILIALFNMVPAFPLDGGRAFRALLWHFKGDLLKATRIASECGSAFGYGLIGWALFRIVNEDFVTGIWWGLLGYFVHAAGEYAVQQTESRTVLSGKYVLDFMRKNPTAVSTDTHLAALVDEYVYNYYQRSFPVVEQNKLVGIVSLDSVLSVDRQRWQWLRVATVMEPISTENTISPDVDAAEALEHMRKTGKTRLLVIAEHELLGILSLTDLLDYLGVTLQLDKSAGIL